MKHRLVTMIAAAAMIGALPGLASAAAMKAHTRLPASEIVSQQTIDNGPMVPAGDDDIGDISNAEHSYLQEVCPTVLANPARQDESLVAFCQEERG
jgi:hypothetical protein